MVVVWSRGASAGTKPGADADSNVAGASGGAENSYETGRTAEGTAWGTAGAAPPPAGAGAIGNADVEGHAPPTAVPPGAATKPAG